MFTCDFLYYKKNIREVLENKVTQLEAKVTRLEATVKHQESLLNTLQTDLPLKAISGSAVIPFAGRSSVSRTCQELRAIDPSLPSGMYWIDPDGQGVGDDAIYVQCDMTSGTQMRNNLKKTKKKTKEFHSIEFNVGRIHICSTQQRIFNQRGTLCRSGMLLEGDYLQRK